MRLLCRGNQQGELPNQFQSIPFNHPCPIHTLPTRYPHSHKLTTLTHALHTTLLHTYKRKPQKQQACDKCGVKAGVLLCVHCGENAYLNPTRDCVCEPGYGFRISPQYCSKCPKGWLNCDDPDVMAQPVPRTAAGAGGPSTARPQQHVPQEELQWPQWPQVQAAAAKAPASKQHK